jgi:hypothetical protein
MRTEYYKSKAGLNQWFGIKVLRIKPDGSKDCLHDNGVIDRCTWSEDMIRDEVRITCDEARQLVPKCFPRKVKVKDPILYVVNPGGGFIDDTAYITLQGNKAFRITKSKGEAVDYPTHLVQDMLRRKLWVCVSKEEAAKFVKPAVAVIIPEPLKFNLVYRNAKGETKTHEVSGPIEKNGTSFTAYSFGKGIRTFLLNRIVSLTKV